MRIGVISGSGMYDWPGLEDRTERTIVTEYGEATVTEGRLGEAEIVHLPRHGTGHHRLSHQVEHRANLAALLACGVRALVSFTVCGAVDPAVAPGSLVVFDDLYFPSNRLPDGSPCTWHTRPGDPERGHWIFDRPYAEPLRRALVSAAGAAGTPLVSEGTYGHVDGPRFNTRAEVRALAAAGVTAISQTAGPEVVLAGEAELPMALAGFVTDHANGVAAVPEPVEALVARLTESKRVFAELAAWALPGLRETEAAGIVYRFGS